MPDTSAGESSVPRDRLLPAMVCVAPIFAAVLVGLLHPELRAAMLGSLPLLARYGIEFIALPLLAWGVLRKMGVRLTAASALACLPLAAFVAYAGIATAASCSLVLAASLAIGARLARLQGVDSATESRAAALVSASMAGMGLMVGVAGWLLPLPIHGIVLYLLVFGAIIVGNVARLRLAASTLSSGWNQAVAASPVAAAFAVAVLGLAAMLAWMPSLNPDDNAWHLGLGRELLDHAYYRLDASSHIFGLSGWFNDLLHAIMVVIARDDSRSGVVILWLFFGATGMFRLLRQLGASTAFAWLAVAVYASLPLTAYYGMSLQVDGASAAVLLHLCAELLAFHDDGVTRTRAVTIGALGGILAGLKVTNAVYIVLIGLWILAWLLRKRQYGALASVATAGALVGLPNYTYAWVVTGNPFLPLYNTVFRSPYMGLYDFVDPRWLGPIHWTLPWDMTVATNGYIEAYPGAAGLVWLGLLGAVVIVLAGRGRRAALGWLAVAGIAGVIVQVAYLRYLFPGVVLLCALALSVVAVSRLRAAGAVALVLLVLLQCALIRSSSWVLQVGTAEELLAGGPASRAKIERRIVPEKALVRRVDERSAGQFCLLFSDPKRPFIALAPGRSLSTGFHDERSSAMLDWADADPSGARWAYALRRVGFTHVENRPSSMNAGLARALASTGFTRTDQLGDAQVWTRLGLSPMHCLTATLGPRDEARRLWSRWSWGSDKPAK